ncbi:CRISPR-associated endonuclease Cas2 [Neolewinella lacunae]|uniref:CRISPR-associated endoribonuclease Cas2 n=1 Tax=Neolewinella lacunae TaxID=1517758 RepID=A0A923PNM4_9BACT|nr:CRISPR-associated endonuclease Cas2 [Neolewinella lacunae]MBC6994624.1 CRISPR-associated endonuclease Cas2 [Neolewinella lacunae]MDN3634496.1 CRISPR-associated endonuclease Cas2 [Neolewinella lacunae]
MILWVLYDVAEDRARGRVARHCKQAGLYRVQYSVFLGEVTADERDALRLEIEDLIDPDHDKVYLFTLTRKELKQAILLGQAFDRKLVTAQVRELFL